MSKLRDGNRCENQEVAARQSFQGGSKANETGTLQLGSLFKGSG